MISVSGLCKSYGKQTVLSQLSFSVEPGEHVLISAPSGGGKTTLLRVLCGLESADAGTISGLAPGDVAFQFQEPRLFPQLTALDNVTCVAPHPEEAKPQALSLLNELGLAEAADKYPRELSGGMMQRVALARTLLADRPVVFLDEPFAALDPQRKASVRELISRYCKEKTLLLVSHDPADGEALTERTIQL